MKMRKNTENDTHATHWQEIWPHTLAAGGPWGAMHHKIKGIKNNNPQEVLRDLTRPWARGPAN